MDFRARIHPTLNIGGGERIVLRSKPDYLRLLHAWSIMSTKIEVEMVVGRVVIPIIIRSREGCPPTRSSHILIFDGLYWKPAQLFYPS